MTTILTKLEALEKGNRMSQLVKDITDLENRLKYGAIHNLETATGCQQLLAEKKKEYEDLKQQLWAFNQAEDEED